MDMKDFFDFGSMLVSSTVQAHAVGPTVNKEGVSIHWNLIKGDYEGINLPIIFKQEYGSKLCDILDTGWVSLFLVSERFKLILEENHLTGWRIFPIKIYDKKNKEIFGYHGLSITGRCGEVDYKKSQIIEKKLVPKGPLCQYYKGIFFDLKSWDKTDFFTPDRSCPIFITKRAANILKKSSISNMMLENLTDVETDLDNVNI